MDSTCMARVEFLVRPEIDRDLKYERTAGGARAGKGKGERRRVNEGHASCFYCMYACNRNIILSDPYYKI
jgi:hypothetical protein